MDLSRDIKREAAAILNEARSADDPAPSEKSAYLKILLGLIITIVTIAVYYMQSTKHAMMISWTG